MYNEQTTRHMYSTWLWFAVTYPLWINLLLAADVTFVR